MYFMRVSFFSRLGLYLKPIETETEVWVLKNKKKLNKGSTEPMIDLKMQGNSANVQNKIYSRKKF